MPSTTSVLFDVSVHAVNKPRMRTGGTRVTRSALAEYTQQRADVEEEDEHSRIAVPEGEQLAVPYPT